MVQVRGWRQQAPPQHWRRGTPTPWPRLTGLARRPLAGWTPFWMRMAASTTLPKQVGSCTATWGAPHYHAVVACAGLHGECPSVVVDGNTNFIDLHQSCSGDAYVCALNNPICASAIRLVSSCCLLAVLHCKSKQLNTVLSDCSIAVISSVAQPGHKTRQSQQAVQTCISCQLSCMHSVSCRQ